MKIAIISDVHENLHNLILALKRIEQEKCDQIIFLGDFMNNAVAKVMAASKTPIFAVWGNNDGDRSALTKTALNPNGNLIISDGNYDFVEFEEKKLFITHYPDLAKPMAKSGEYDAVFYGHNHLKNKEKINGCLVLNPGEISAHKTGEATLAIYETETNDAEIITLENAVTLLTKEVEEYLKNADFEFSKTKRQQV